MRFVRLSKPSQVKQCLEHVPALPWGLLQDGRAWNASSERQPEQMSEPPRPVSLKELGGVLILLLETCSVAVGVKPIS